MAVKLALEVAAFHVGNLAPRVPFRSGIVLEVTT